MLSRLAASAVAVVVLAVAVGVLGVSAPGPDPRVGTDRLGPDSDQSVEEYVSYAEAGLRGDDGSARWALLSLRAALTTAELASLVGDIRVSEVYAHVGIDRVQTPVVVVPVSAHPVSVANAVTEAASQVISPFGSRGAAVAAVTRSRLLENCACAAAALVRAAVADLRELAASPAVRAIEALPSDAVYSKFSVRPLLPDTLDTSVVPPDDGEVPAR